MGLFDKMKIRIEIETNEGKKVEINLASATGVYVGGKLKKNAVVEENPEFIMGQADAIASAVKVKLSDLKFIRGNLK